MSYIGYAVVTIALGFYTNILNGWAVAKLWHWFIVPTFKLPELSIPIAIGVSLIVTYLTIRISTKKDERGYGEQMCLGFALGTIKPLCFVLMGWVITLFL